MTDTSVLRRVRLTRSVFATSLAVLLLPSAVVHAATGSVHGHVQDPLGALVPAAEVDLVDSAGHSVVHAVASPEGSFELAVPRAGRYRIVAHAAGFRDSASPSTYFVPGRDAYLNVTLATPVATQTVTVTATALPTPAAQTGASVSVLDSSDFRYAPEVQEPLRTIPGVQMTQTGQAGGSTALFMRGANSNATKVLIDGVPANDIGGAVEFGNIASVGIRTIEVLRQPNSSLYGADALAGVVSLTTTRGTTTLPQLRFSGDAGNLHTHHEQVEAGGVYHQLDYYSAFDRLDTANNIPNDEFHNVTYAGNFGWTPEARDDLRFTVRRVATRSGLPSAIALFGIPDAAGVRERDSFYSAVWNNQTTSRWHNQVRYGGLRLNYLYTDYAPTGLPTTPDPSTADYLGAPVTITGANGYSVSGQGILQFGGTAYPNSYNAPTRRDLVYAQSDARLNPHTVALGSFNYEAERGSTLSLPGSSPAGVSGSNYTYTMQVSGDLRNRLFYLLGTGLEKSWMFGFAPTPRASVAYYLSRPSAMRWMGGTKLHASFSKGIKEPSIFYQTNSLYNLLTAQTAAQSGIRPIGPETSRTYDGGVDQELFHSRARVGLTYFHDEFTNGIEYVSNGGLIQLGVPAASLGSIYGAAVNSMAFRTQGVELEGEWQLASHLFTRGGYTFTDAVVQRSFSSDNLQGGSFNTASNFGSVPIGAYSPLDGQRPFRRAPHTGFFSLSYARGPWYTAVSGTLVGKRDDSTYLLDANYGNSLLLPNRDLLGSYQRVEAESSYRINRTLTTYVRLQNLLDEHYFEAFGYPSLPLTFRAGMTITFGGESWKLK